MKYDAFDFYYLQVKAINLKYKKFHILDTSEMERCISVRYLSGRMTRGRWKKLHRLARLNTYRKPRCGHDYDCYGCECQREMELGYKHNQLSIEH